MFLIQLTGLSGAGKTTLANAMRTKLSTLGYTVEIIDADIYRRHVCSDLGYSKKDRCENIRRLGFIGLRFATNNVIAILAAINPFDQIRKELKAEGDFVKLVWIKCDIQTLINRDPKGLYSRALLPDSDRGKIKDFTGIDHPFEEPTDADLVIDTGTESQVESELKFLDFLQHCLSQRNEPVAIRSEGS